MPINPFRSAIEMVREMRLSSVLQPLLPVLLFLVGGLIVTSFSDNAVIQHFLMYAISIVAGVYLLSYLGILILGDKKWLRSEKHTENMRALELIGDEKNRIQPGEHLDIENNPELPDPKTVEIPSPQSLKKLEVHEQ